jgi:hypothetical protein
MSRGRASVAVAEGGGTPSRGWNWKVAIKTPVWQVGEAVAKDSGHRSQNRAE